jgi:hypothetical protein
MKHIILLVSILLGSVGCSKDSATLSLEHQERIRYFNSEKTAKELYVAYMHFFKTNNFNYLAKNNSKRYYLNASYKMNKAVFFNEVSKKKYNEVIEQTVSEHKLYYSNNILEGITVYKDSRLFTYYTKDDNKPVLTLSKNGAEFIYEYSNSIECSRWDYGINGGQKYKKKNCKLLQLRYNESYDLLELAYKFRERESREIFKKIYDTNNKKTIFKDEKKRIKKVIDYEKMNIKYYFYQNETSYEVICSYPYRKCKVMRYDG